MIKVWISKYALSKGIISAEADLYGGPSKMVAVKNSRGYPNYYHYRDWHKTEACALARAEEMRTAKIASLKKQIAKLEKLSFGAST